MATLVRNWEIGALHRRRACAACDSPRARPARPVLAEGFSAARLEDYVPWVPLCADCALRQLRATRSLTRRVLAASLVPALVPALVAAAVPAQSPWPMALVVVAATAAWQLTRLLARGVKAPALLAGGEGTRLTVHLDVPDGSTSSRDAVERLPDRTGAHVPFVAAVLVGFVLTGLTWNAANPEVLLHNPSASACDFAIDGDGYRLPPYDLARLRLRAGPHRVVALVEGGPELVTARVPWGRSLVVAVSRPGCYAGVGRRRTFEVDDIHRVEPVACDDP